MSKSELVSKDESIHPVATQQDQYMGLIQMAVEKGADINQLEKLMDLQDRFEAKNAKKSFFNALSIFQSMTVTIKKTGLASFPTKNNGRTEYTYAKLEDIARVIRPSLKEAGLSYRYEQSSDNNLMTVVCIVTQKEGHQERTSMSAFADQSGSKNQIQQIASTISYLRRYTLTGALGITVGDDDDDGACYNPEEIDQVQHESINTEEKDITPSNEFYPEELFDKNISKWLAAIENKKKTAEEIISMVSTKGQLTEEQTKTIKGEV